LEDFKMMNYFHSTRTVLVSAVVAFSFAIGAGAPGLAQADKVEDQVKRVDKEHRKKIREANDLKFKAREPGFPELADSRAKNFRETAEIVARHGGDAKPLLDAADYFEKQSELIKSQADKTLPDPTASHARARDGSHHHTPAK
jgi:hypothetical protein